MRIQPFAFIGGGAESFLAIGGITGSFVSSSVEYQYHIFSSSADFTVVRGTNNAIEILLVGGGGAGQNNAGVGQPGNGGGGGGVMYTSSVYMNRGVYGITIANGGLTTDVQDGQASGSKILGNNVFFAVSGGYQGGQAYSGEPQYNIYGDDVIIAAGSGKGGGGGAGSVGGAAFNIVNDIYGGNGGTGSLVRIMNTSSYFGGGGGGGAVSTFSEFAGSGGLGGGGGAATSGSPNTGGGGGGRHDGGTNEEKGGSGIAIVQYRTLGYPSNIYTLGSGSTNAQACSRYASGSTNTYYSYSNLLVSGSTIFGPNDYNGLFTGYLSNGTQVYNVISGGVTEATGCPTVYSFTLSSGSQQYAPAACLLYASSSTSTLYGTTSTIQSGSKLYTDSILLTTASNGYVASGSGYWQLINGAPISTSATPCDTIYNITLSGTVTGSAQAALNDTTTATYYALSSSLQSGSLLFTTSSMTAVVGDGYLATGSAGYWQFINGAPTTTPAQIPYIVTDGLQFMVDAGTGSSYPGSGTTWSDLSGNGYNATLVGSPTFTSNASASYFSFNGSSQYATFTPPLAESDSTYSYFAIFYPNANQTKMILYQGNESSNRRGAMIQCDSSITPPDGGLGFNGFGNDSISGCGGVVPVSLSNWQTFSFTLDTAAGTPFNLYKNGGLSASGSATGGATNLNLGNSAARIAANGSNGEIFNGRIAVCMMYNRVLTADEIRQNHNYFAGRYGLARV